MTLLSKCRVKNIFKISIGFQKSEFRNLSIVLFDRFAYLRYSVSGVLALYEIINISKYYFLSNYLSIIWSRFSLTHYYYDVLTGRVIDFTFLVHVGRAQQVALLLAHQPFQLTILRQESGFLLLQLINVVGRVLQYSGLPGHQQKKKQNTKLIFIYFFFNKWNERLRRRFYGFWGVANGHYKHNNRYIFFV